MGKGLWASACPKRFGAKTKGEFIIVTFERCFGETNKVLQQYIGSTELYKLQLRKLRMYI